MISVYVIWHSPYFELFSAGLSDPYTLTVVSGLNVDLLCLEMENNNASDGRFSLIQFNEVCEGKFHPNYSSLRCLEFIVGTACSAEGRMGECVRGAAGLQSARDLMHPLRKVYSIYMLYSRLTERQTELR